MALAPRGCPPGGSRACLRRSGNRRLTYHQRQIRLLAGERSVCSNRERSPMKAGPVTLGRQARRLFGFTPIQAVALMCTIACLWLLVPTALAVVFFACVAHPAGWAYGLVLSPFALCFFLMVVAGS